MGLNQSVIKKTLCKGNIFYFTPYARQLVGKTKPQITPEAFVYFGSYIEEKMSSISLHLGQVGRCLMISTSFRSIVISDSCSFTFLVVGIIRSSGLWNGWPPWVTTSQTGASRWCGHRDFIDYSSTGNPHLFSNPIVIDK